MKLVLNTVFLAHGVIATSDWQYRDQRLALSLPAIDVLYNREQYYLFFNRCPWPILLTWCAIKFQPERRIIHAILIPLHPNQPLGETYIFSSISQSFHSHKDIFISLSTPNKYAYVVVVRKTISCVCYRYFCCKLLQNIATCTVEMLLALLAADCNPGKLNGYALEYVSCLYVHRPVSRKF